MSEWNLQVFLYILSGIFGLQASKSASLGGQQILDCELHFPENRPVTYIIEWKKHGLNNPVYAQFDGYPSNVHPQFKGRVRLVNGISLEISHIQEPDEGWYECKVEYLDGIENEDKKSNGTWIYLNVYIPPKIISSSPQSFHQPLGSTVRIYCKAEGSPKPDVTWTKDGRTLMTSSRLTLQNEGTEVHISDLQDNDGGIFKCTFRNPIGLITQTIHLIVEGQAYIIGPPSNKTAVLGQRITFTCEARGYPANITYRWYRDNRNVNTLPSYGDRIIIHDNDGSLVIKIVEKEDMGWYLCRPSNGVGQDPEASAYLNITYTPVVLTKLMPRSLIWAIGFQERLHCPVDANPPAKEIVWTKNGIVIEYLTNRLSLLPNGTLLVNSVQNSDAGNYRCTAISTFGNGDSEIIQIEVKDPPRFTIRPQAQYIRQPAQTVRMPCVAVGTPYPTITWRKLSGGLVFDGRIQQNRGNLTIQTLQKSDHGVYECEAKNEVRKIITSTELIIQNTTPHAPYNVTVEANLFTATIRWIPAYSNFPQHFVIWFRSVINNVASAWQSMAVVPSDTTRFTLYNLEPDTLYQFKLLARNQLGSGQYSDTVEAHTLGYSEGIADKLPTDANNRTYLPPIVKSVGPRPAEPINVSAVPRHNGVYITWTPPSRSTVKIFGYVVEHQAGNIWEQVGSLIDGSTSLQYNKLEPGTLYKFRVLSRGVLAYSLPSNVATVEVPAEPAVPNNYSTESESGFGLSQAEIGGIVGGLLFLIVSITVAVVAVFCNKRSNRKRQATKYNNVKYLGPQDDVDGRPEYAPEWSDGPSDGRGNTIDSYHGNTIDSYHGNTIDSYHSSIWDTNNSIFMVPQSGNMYRAYNDRVKDPYLSDRENSMYDPTLGRGVPQYNAADSRVSSRRSANVSRRSNRSRRSRRSRRSVPDDDDDENGFNDDNGFKDYRRRNPNRNRSRSQPGARNSAGEPGYPAPDRPRSRGHSILADGRPKAASTSPDRFQPESFQQQPHPQTPVSPPYTHTPLFSPVSAGHGHPYPSYPGDDDDDEEVFMPPPVTSVLPGKPGFPRHSSMKPGAQQTYLTDEFGSPSGPFMPADLSSVLPSPFSDSHSHGPYRPYQRQYPDSSDQRVPYGSHSRLPDYSHNGSYGDMDNTVVPRQQSPDRTMSRTLPRLSTGSSESSGRPMNYTRDHLLGVVDKVRKGPRAVKRVQPRGSRGSGSEIDSVSESPIPGRGSSGGQIPESMKPSVIVRDRPSRAYPYDLDPGKGPGMTDSRASVNSSGLGSQVGRGRPADMTPDSISSGIGSRNTSSQLTGSSLHSRPSRLGSNVTPQEYDLSEDSGTPYLDYPPPVPHRKDISGDENYEFDSYNAVESDLLEALRNYSEVNNGNDDLLNALEDGLNTAGMFSELYPKPSRQSRYSDSEQRFEKLRGEFQKYRQEQERSSMYEDQRSPYDPGHGHRNSTLGSRRGSGSDYHSRYGDTSAVNASRGNGYSGTGRGFYGDMGENSSYKAGPMDSDML